MLKDFTEIILFNVLNSPIRLHHYPQCTDKEIESHSSQILAQGHAVKWKNWDSDTNQSVSNGHGLNHLARCQGSGHAREPGDLGAPGRGGEGAGGVRAEWNSAVSAAAGPRRPRPASRSRPCPP